MFPVFETSGRGGRRLRFALVDGVASLVWLANSAAIELHPLSWWVERSRVPDQIVFDLDPGPPAGLVEAARVALLLRPRLEELGLEPLAKTSGSIGVRVHAHRAAALMPCEQSESDSDVRQARTCAESETKRAWRFRPAKAAATVVLMPRKPRAFFDGIYHVSSHGSDDRHLFLSDAERSVFLDGLSRTFERFELGVVAYTLMGNHYHTLLRIPDARVSRALQHLHTWYSRLHNNSTPAPGTSSARTRSCARSSATMTC